MDLNQHDIKDVFEWDPKYSVGVEDLDNQHKFLLEFGKKVHLITPEMVDDFLREVIRFSKEHFKEEEKHMKEICFPLLDEHTKIHADLIEDLEKLLHTHDEAIDKVELAVNLYFTNVLQHIMDDDMEYFHFCQKK